MNQSFGRHRPVLHQRHFSTLSDDELIKHFREGDTDAVTTVTDWVRAVVLRRVWVEGVLPDDIVNDTLEELLTIFRSDDFIVHTSLKGFVQSVAKHTAIDALRKHQRHRRGNETLRLFPSENLTPEELLIQKEKAELWKRILKKIDEKCRMIWLKIFHENVHYSKVAAEMRMTDGAMRTRLARCKAAAMKILKGQE